MRYPPKRGRVNILYCRDTLISQITICIINPNYYKQTFKSKKLLNRVSVVFILHFN